jgi:peptidyl-prolyl cis-trans isomerase A (cyclophilin A)
MNTMTRFFILLPLAGIPALAQADADPVPPHTISLAEATKGLKGTGPLVASMEVEQSGKKLGIFTCELFDKQAPKTVANFVGLARGVRPFLDPETNRWVKRPFYNGLTFHRVIPEFMIQGGDPKGNGTGNPGYQFEDELSDQLKMDKGGVLAMANAGPGTNGSQFFITEKATPWLTGRHTIFGQCEPVSLESNIARTPTGPRNAPTTPVVIKKVTISRGSAGAIKQK